VWRSRGHGQINIPLWGFQRGNGSCRRTGFDRGPLLAKDFSQLARAATISIMERHGRFCARRNSRAASMADGISTLKCKEF
jgi:hypothetical protein